MDNSELEVVKLIPRNQDSDDSDLLAAMLDKATCPIAYITHDYRYKYVNKAYTEWVGVNACDIIGKKIQDVLGDATFSALKDYMEAAVHGKEVHYEEEILYSSGTRIVDGTYTPDFDQSGSVKGYIAVLNDITRKRAAEKEIKNSKQALSENIAHYERVLAILPVPVYATDKNGYITFYNEAAVNLWGRRPEIGVDKWSGFDRIYACDGITPVPLENIPLAIALREHRAITGEELVVEREDKTLRRILPNPKALFDSEGNVNGAINLILDITDNRMAEEEKAKLAAIVESSDDAIISKTLDGIVSSWNNSAAMLFGYTEEEMIGQPITKIIPADRLNEEPEILSRLRRGERVDHFETRRIAKDGTMLDISLTISPIKDGNGRIIGASKIARNITEQKEAARLIQENEERFRMAVEATKLGTWEYQPLTGKLEWSNECRKIYGVPAHVSVDYDFFINRVHPDDRQKTDEEIRKGMETGSDGNYDLQFRIVRYSDRQTRWIRVQGKTFFTEYHLTRIIGTVVDITNEKLQQDELIESVELFQTMAENVPAMIWMSGSDKFNDYFNRTWLEFTGRTLEEESNEGWLKGVHPDDIEKCIEVYNRSLKEQDGFYIEYRLRRRDQQYRWIADNSVPRYSPEGVFLGFISACIDIDDQKRFSEKIQDSELLFKTISHTSPAALWMTDKDQKNIFVSDTWLRWTGCSFSDAVGQGWVNSLFGEDREKVTNRFQECFEARKNFSAEFRLPAENGNVRWCLTEGKPYYDINGFFAGYAGSVADITELKSLEQRKDDFIKMASHELKTPITSINGYVQLLLNIYQDAEGDVLNGQRGTIKSSLTTISKQVSKLTRLISELLDLSKIESGKLELHCSEFDLTELVEEVVQDMRQVTSNHAITVHSDFDRKIFGDKDRIGQVLTNLLNNAIKYSPAADRVEVYVQGNKKNVSVKVRDFGIGIDKKDFKKIFERFYRVEGKSEQTYPGFGIGLFIASEIIQRHHGTIDVSSEKGHSGPLIVNESGSLFTINLPLDFRHEAN